ncbi:MAG: hypothetical protein ACRC6U_06540 [Fusobacteriaceae bacterium]
MDNKNKKSEIFIYIIIFIFVLIFGNYKKSEVKLILKYNSSTIGIGQIFYDDGKGFSEIKSIKYDVKEGMNTKIIALPNIKITNLRLDPIEKKDVNININEILLLDHQKLIKLEIANLGGVVRLNEQSNLEFKTLTTDPIFILKNINISSDLSINYFLIIAYSILFMSLYKYRKYLFEKKKIFLVFILIFLLNLLRSPDAILNPIIYTEDGPWISNIMKKGLFDTLLNARRDYFVMGNIILLYISYILNKISLSGLEKLPFYISTISYLFYSIAYTYIWFCLDKIIKNIYVKSILLFTMILIPFGTSFNELMGRISNIGYIIPVLVLLSIVSYENNIEKKGIYIFGIIGVLTNPISFIYLGIYFIYRFVKVKNREYLKEVLSFWLLKLISLITFVSIVYRYSIVGNTATLTSEKILKESIIELILARSLFYPFIFSIYTKLTDTYIVSIFVLFIVFTIFIFKKSNEKSKLVILQIGLGWLIYTFMALIMRPGLTNYIKGYSNTFPDRYFYAQNILAIILILIVLDKGLEILSLKIIAKTLLLGISFIYIFNFFNLIEFNNPKMLFGKETFEESFYKNLSFEEKIIRVPIVPKNWIMEIPIDEIE